MLREELADSRARLAAANDGRSAAERTAAQLCAEAQNLRARAVAAEAARLKVGAEFSVW